MIQKFISKLSDKEKKIFYATVVVVLLSFLDRLFLGPVTAKLKSIDEDIKYKETSIKRDSRFLAYKDRILNEKKILQHFYNQKHQTEEEIIAAFLRRIEALASQANINLIKVNPSEGEQKKGYRGYSASLECNGKLKDVVTFMHLVDTSDELIRITVVNMTAKKSSSDEITSVMSISKIIVEEDPGDQAKKDEPAEKIQEAKSSPNRKSSGLKDQTASQEKLIQVDSANQVHEKSQDMNKESADVPKQTPSPKAEVPDKKADVPEKFSPDLSVPVETQTELPEDKE